MKVSHLGKALEQNWRVSTAGRLLEYHAKGATLP